MKERKELTLEQVREFEGMKTFVRGGAPTDDETDPEEAGEEVEQTGDEGEAGEQVEETEENNEGEQPEETEDEETEPEEKPAPAAKPRRDPTEGMTIEQKLEFYRKRSGHFEKEYKRERTKRQGLQKGGASSGLASAFASGPKQETETEKPNEKPLDEMSPAEFLEVATKKAQAEMRKEFTETQKTNRMRSSDAAAREKFDGSDGRPTYDEMLDDVVAPFIREHPQVFHMLREMPNPGEAAYALGLLLNPELQEGETKRTQAKARTELVKKIDDAAKKAVTIKNGGNGGGAGKGKRKVHEFSDEEFEAEIARAKDQ